MPLLPCVQLCIVGPFSGGWCLHKPWIGPSYRKGGLMLWGFSHHKRDDELDGESFTNDVVKSLALTGDHWFFSRIMSYFEEKCPERFWNGVAFANTLPSAVLSDDRYSHGSDEMRQSVKSRVVEILSDVMPSKTILFSRKGWNYWPELNGSAPEPSRELSTSPIVRFGSYRIAEKEVWAYCLPHPQFSKTSDMVHAVQSILHHSQ